MSSFRRLISSRANAALSTGPKSISGKRRSSLNALRHGFRSQNVVVLENESRADFDALLQESISDYRPRNPLETACVTRIAIAEWRLRRLSAIEIGLWTEALASQSAGDQFDREAEAFSYLCTLPAFRALHRYEGTQIQAFEQAGRDLLKLRRPKNQSPANLDKQIYTNEATLSFLYSGLAKTPPNLAATTGAI